jgi:hypothetical protein
MCETNREITQFVLVISSTFLVTHPETLNESVELLAKPLRGRGSAFHGREDWR